MFKEELVKCYVWSIDLYGAETWDTPGVYEKYLESLEVWCGRRMEEMSRTERVRNQVLQSQGGQELQTKEG
jgi:hypothetical protein